MSLSPFNKTHTATETTEESGSKWYYTVQDFQPFT